METNQSTERTEQKVYRMITYKRVGPSEKGAYGFSNIMRANDVDDVIYDVTIGNIQHATQTFL